MNYALIALTALFSTFQNIFKQKYNDRCSHGTYFFSGTISLFAMLFFMAVNRDWGYRAALLLPSCLFAASYAAATVFVVLAIKYGSLTKTALILSYSLLIPTGYGILFLKESVGVALLLGLALLAVSLWLTNNTDRRESARGGWKWLIFVALAFVGNGMCSAVQKWEQIRYGAEHQNMFMIVALAMVTVCMFVASAVTPERRLNTVTIRKGWWLALLCGAMNGAVNYLVIWLNSRVAASVMFPMLSGLGLVLVFLYSLLLRKEKFTHRQYVGYAVGLVSIILLNL